MRIEKDYFGDCYQTIVAGKWSFILLKGSEAIAKGEGYDTEEDAEAAMFAEFSVYTKD